MSTILLVLALCALDGDAFAPANIVVASFDNDAVVVFDELGEVVADFNAVAGLDGPWDVEFGPEGLLYVSSSLGGGVLVVDHNGDVVMTLAAPGVVQTPRGITFGPGGRVYVSSYGNDSVAVFARDGAYIESIALPVGNGKPNDLAFDPDGVLWVASEEGSALVALTAQGAASAVISLSGPPHSLVFGDSYLCRVSVPSLNTVELVDASERTLTQPLLFAFPSPTGLARANNSQQITSVAGTNTMLRDGFGIFGGLEWSSPALQGPCGVAVAPFRFEMTLKGKLVNSGSGGGGQVAKFKATGTLSLYGGTSQALVTLDQGPLSDALGRDVLVMQAMKSREAVGKFDNGRVFLRLVEGGEYSMDQGGASMFVEHKLKTKGEFFSDERKLVAKVKGRLQANKLLSVAEGRITKVVASN